ncbi:MAG: TetR/AcrR family transcriptional regulator [Bacteroidales bacterium]|nr:TetR/AcrR family transcriptional regulator [Bacteroidales bacterium]
MESKLEEILEVSEQLFRRNGIRSVSMDDISNALGVSKKTLYKHVSDKNRLVNLTLENAIARQRLQQKDCEKGANAIESFYMVYKNLTDMIRQANFAVEYDLQKYYPKLYLKMRELRHEKMKSGITENLKRGIREGLYREDLDVETITKLNVLLSESMHDYDFLEDNKDRLIHILQVNFDYHIHAIVTEKGLQVYLEILKRNKNLF